MHLSPSLAFPTSSNNYKACSREANHELISEFGKTVGRPTVCSRKTN
jgi:hypothetical protein